MSENISEITGNQAENQPKAKRPYRRRQAIVAQLPQNVPNPNISSLESELLPLVRRKMELESGVMLAENKANQANAELQQFQSALSQVTSQVQYIQQVIAQMKGVPFVPTPSFQQQQYGIAPGRFADYPQAVPPSPTYTPAVPYPTQPYAAPQPGVSSFPAQNRGLYPDATPRVDENGVEYNDGSAVREPMSVLEGRYER